MSDKLKNFSSSKFTPHLFIQKGVESIRYVYIILLVCLSAFVLFYGLGDRSLKNWDEAVYALISQEVIEKGELTLYLNNEPWFEKPPLGFFIEALSIAILGFNEFAIRFPSSLYIFISIIIVYLLGKELFNYHIGFLSALLTIISPSLLHDHMARSGDLDSGLFLFTVLAFYLLVKSENNKKLFIFSAVAAGLGIMIRGSSGLFIVLISALYLLFSGQWRNFKPQDYLFYCLALFIVVLPWHLHQLIVHGRQFWEVYIKEHFLSRISTPLQGHAGEWDYYFMYFRWRWGIIHYLVWWAFIYGSIKMLIFKEKRLILPFLWLVIISIPLIYIKTKLWWYAITLIPPMIYFLSYFLSDLVKKKRILLVSALNLLLIYFWLAEDKINAFRFNQEQLQLFMVIVLAVSLVVALLLKILTKNKFLETSVMIFLWVFFVGLNIFFIKQGYYFITKQSLDPIHIISNRIAAAEKEGTDVVVYNTLGWYKGWLLPQAKYYLEYVHNNKTYLIGQKNLEHYIAQDQYVYFITNLEGLKDMERAANQAYFFTKSESADDIILVKKSK